MRHKYSPGLHKLLTLEVLNSEKVTNITAFEKFANQIIKEQNLEIVGISKHTFDSDGFTAAICLMESHICVHTWPEFNQLTLDIYLCNYLKDNSAKVETLAQAFKSYFEAKILNETNVYR
jgi:S-adenosylmethionine decarboxylase